MDYIAVHIKIEPFREEWAEIVEAEIVDLGFDSFTVVLLSEGRQQMIYKHAISTIAPLSPIDLHEADETGEE